MKFLFPCEEIVRSYLPAMRAGIARNLRKKGYTQEQIAKELGLTQAAVSKYLTEKRRAKPRDSLQNVVEKASKQIADEIASGKDKKAQVNKAICSACVEFNSDFLSCGLMETASV